MQTALVEQARSGDREAFAVLAGGAVDRLYGIARNILRDAELAEDATQEALVRAWRDLPALRDAARFDAWLYRLLVNACNAESRRERHHRGNLRLLATDEPTVPDAASRIATRHELDHAFRRLGVEHRTVVVLIHYLGLSSSEAADVMGTPVGTVRSRLHYALKSMREALEADARLERSAGTA